MYGNTYVQIRDDVEEEVTAQYFGVAITRGSIDEFLKADGEEKVSTEKIGFLEKLKEIFKRIAAALQKKLEELAKKDLVAASVMQADVKELQKAVETFDAVLESVRDLSAARTGSAAASAVRTEGAEQNKNTAEGAVKMSKASYDFSKSFEEQIDDFKAGKFPRNDSIVVCGTPKIFQKIGLNSLPMLYAQGHLRDALINADGDHLGEVNLKKVPAALKTPIAIIDNANHPGRLVAIIEIPAHNRNVIAAVEIDGTGRMHEKRIDGNVITTIHSRDNAISKLLRDAVLSESQGKGGIYFWDKNKALVSARSHGGQFPGGSTVPDGFIRSISDSKSNVNKKLQSALQSKQFRRWFMGSKVVNPDGSPRIVYHQTAAQFTVFNTNNPVAGKNDSETPNGIFFKDNDHDIGIGGDKQMAV